MLFSALSSAPHFDPLLSRCSTSLCGSSRCSTSTPQRQFPFQRKTLSPDSNLAFPQPPRHSFLPVLASSKSSPSPGQTDSALSGQQDNDVEGEEESSSDAEVDSGDGIEIEVTKVGRNRRKVQARAAVAADLETLWGVLTDYEGLADFIPGLAISQLVEKADGFARLYQVGQQDLALGLKFDAKGVLDCYEKDLELLPSGRRRNIEFRMIDGDFKTFEGVWSIIQDDSASSKEEEEEDTLVEGQGFQTVLMYEVEVEPKLWLPVGLIQGKLCREVRTNISSVREEAQRIQRSTIQSRLPSR